MKIKLTGWRRQMHEHLHDVVPVSGEDGQHYPREDLNAISWVDDSTVVGKVDHLALSGSFLVKFIFTNDELSAWLMRLAKAHPKPTLRLLAKAQKIALDERDRLKGLSKPTP